MLRLARLITVTAALLCSSVGTALAADGPVGADPVQNFPVDTLPAVCNQPTSTACLNASIVFLNQARTSLGQPAYALPSNFTSLTPGIQEFVLANLDRTLYGLPPITGITAALSRDAMGGVLADNDPQPSDTTFNYWTANWAGGFGNVVLAYEAWMYDDGPGSGNLDCTSRSSSGCWGHRHDILWSFGGSGALAAGVASGNDRSGDPGYSLLLGEGDARVYRPNYTYTWSTALAAGANGGSSSGSGSATGSAPSTPTTPSTTAVTISVHGTGTVVDAAGHSCRQSTCTFSEPAGHAIALTEHAGGDTTFGGWGGACNGAAATCTVAPGASAVAVSAAFAPRARLSRRSSRVPHAHPSAVRFGRGAVHAIVRVRGRRIVVRITAPRGARLLCALSARTGRHFSRDHFHACRSVTVFNAVPRGLYRLRIRTRSGAITDYLRSR